MVRIVLDHLGGVYGGTFGGVVRIVLNHLGGVCGGTNSLKSRWCLCYCTNIL